MSTQSPTTLQKQTKRPRLDILRCTAVCVESLEHMCQTVFISKVTYGTQVVMVTIVTFPAYTKYDPLITLVTFYFRVRNTCKNI